MEKKKKKVKRKMAVHTAFMAIHQVSDHSIILEFEILSTE